MLVRDIEGPDALIEPDLRELDDDEVVARAQNAVPVKVDAFAKELPRGF